MNHRFNHAKSIAKECHGKIPVLRALPIRVLAVIMAVTIVNMLCWAGVGVVLNKHKGMTGASVLAYTLGLRHALDADHIAAIDLTTRKLIASGQRPVTVGMYFSLGHSTIVIITSTVVAGTTAGVSKHFDDFARVGGIVGTSVSAAFLLILGAINIYILSKLFKQLNMLLRSSQEGILLSEGIVGDWDTPGAGCLTRMCRALFRFIDRPWKMYPLGVLFGLGFDTSSEVALLGMASIEAAHGTSIWVILIFPVLFTAAMCLVDTTDGALMSALYTTSSFAHDDIAIVYYSIVLTTLTILVAVVIGVIQILSLIHHVREPTGPFWDGVKKVGERYDIVGGCIAGLFVVTGIMAYFMYTPIREIIDRKRFLIEHAASAPFREGVSVTPTDTPRGANTTTRVSPPEGEVGTGGKDRGKTGEAVVRHFEGKGGSSGM
ncbi:high-affinity nickel-transport protein-domain-containing protein [Tuber indicum]|nr:high-affinity nickel-transport protein-domain-containing protein [Tuber indicum]